MKHLIAVISLVFWLSAPVLAQTTKPAAGIPPFKILQTNGHFFEASQLDKTKPVVLIYFAPDCSHCQVLMENLFKNFAAFKNTQLVLVTFKPMSELQLFERQYNTTSYPNIKAGTEGSTYYLRYYYNISNTPFTAVYNKGNLVCSYRNINTPVSEIINCVKNLK